MNRTVKNSLIITLVLIVVTIVYLTITYGLKQYFLSTTEYNTNEFGDFIGGLLNPLFTLLSTVSIIFLTYIVAKGNDVKADLAIETQKRLTINQMRQTAFEGIIQKTNFYVYQIDKISAHEVKGKFHQMLLTKMIKDEQQEKSSVTAWFIILNELENFTQLNYLFSGLFQKENFKTKHNELIEITYSLCQQQNEFHFVKPETIKDYIDTQQEFLTIIGNYIYSEF